MWSVHELLTFRVPPLAWVAPKRRSARPRPDYLVEEHASDPADLSERLRAARGEGFTLGLHPTLALELDALLQAWQEAQAQQN